VLCGKIATTRTANCMRKTAGAERHGQRRTRRGHDRHLRRPCHAGHRAHALHLSGHLRELGPTDVAQDAIRSSKYLYVTGYLWDTDSQKEAVLLAMRTAKEAGRSGWRSTCPDPFCVNRTKRTFLKITREYVDLLIGNEEEAQHLTDTDKPARRRPRHDPVLSEWAGSRGERDGALLRQGDEVLTVPAHPVHAVDTTGAGDMYAAGILYGLTTSFRWRRRGGWPAIWPPRSSRISGPRLEEIDQEAVRRPPRLRHISSYFSRNIPSR